MTDAMLQLRRPDITARRISGSSSSFRARLRDSCSQAGFYDRSLGTVQNGTATAGPYRLTRASITTGTRKGELTTQYDDAGNLIRMDVDRDGTCLPSVLGCSQTFLYEWDELGRLTRARRYDFTNLDADFPPIITIFNVPGIDLKYRYDSSDQRVIKSALPASLAERHTVYIFPTLELRRAQYGTAFGSGGQADYELVKETEVPYLMANDVRLARVVYQEGLTVGVPGTLRVFLEMGDHLGSTSTVIDLATSEVVERSTYTVLGGPDSDYRPARWKNFREDYRFTGKEEDVEVGLTYFGKRYYAPGLGRWASADPLGVHDVGKADLNLYAYVRGQALRNVDPVGLQDAETTSDPEGVIRAEVDAARNARGADGMCDGNMSCDPQQDYPSVYNTSNLLNQAQPEMPGSLAEVTERARNALPAGVRDDPTLTPVVGPGGVQGWVTERSGVSRLHSPTGERVGYAGETPLEASVSPGDFAGPGAAKGLWLLGGSTLRLGNAARKGVAQWHFQRTVTRAQAGLTTEAEAIRLTSAGTTRAALYGGGKIAAMNYGQIVEAATGDRLVHSWISRQLYRPASGDWLAPGRLQGSGGRFQRTVDFHGRGVFRGLEFDVTTVGQAATHRLKYPGVLIGEYPGLVTGSF